MFSTSYPWIFLLSLAFCADSSEAFFSWKLFRRVNWLNIVQNGNEMNMSICWNWNAPSSKFLARDYVLDFKGPGINVNDLAISVFLFEGASSRGWFGRIRKCQILGFRLPVAQYTAKMQYRVTLVQKQLRKKKAISKSPLFAVKSLPIAVKSTPKVTTVRLIDPPIPALPHDEAVQWHRISSQIQTSLLISSLNHDGVGESVPLLLHCGSDFVEKIYLTEKLDGGATGVFKFSDTAVLFLPNYLNGPDLMAVWPAVVEEEYTFSRYALENGLLAQHLFKCALALESEPGIRIQSLVAESFDSLKRKGRFVIDAKKFGNGITDVVEESTLLKSKATVEDLLPLLEPLFRDLVTATKFGYSLNSYMANMILVPRVESSDVNNPRPLSDFVIRLFLYHLTSKRYRSTFLNRQETINVQLLKSTFCSLVHNLLTEINAVDYAPDIYRKTYTSGEEINDICAELFHRLARSS